MYAACTPLRLSALREALPRRVLIVTTTSALLAACGPERHPEPRGEPNRYAAAVCEAAANCTCLLEDQDPETCTEQQRERFAAMLDANPSIDEDCFEQRIAELRAGDCEPEDGTGDRCVLVEGDKPRGAACNPWRGLTPFVVSECAEGLGCGAGHCLAPSDRLPAVEPGTPCSLDDVSPCPSADPNVQQYCGYDGRCHEAADVGEPCDASLGCRHDDVAGNFCAGVPAAVTGICTPRLPIGHPCDPRDVSPCFESNEAGLGWCDAITSRCVRSDEVPLACVAATWPR